jgi:hypothetical protein
MNDTLERRYRRLLSAYPRAYRAERGDELLETLMELRRPGQRWPAAREVVALLLAGVRARAGADELRSPADVWLGGARVALLLVVWLQLLSAVHAGAAGVLTMAVVAGQVLLATAAVVAILRGHYRSGLALALLAPLPPLVEALTGEWTLTAALVGAALWWLPVLVLAAPVLRHRRAPAGPWRWQLLIPGFVIVALRIPPMLGLHRTALVLLAVGLAAGLAWALLLDPRPAIGLALALATTMPQLVVYLSWLSILAPSAIAVVALLVAGVVRTELRIRAT